MLAVGLVLSAFALQGCYVDADKCRNYTSCNTVCDYDIWGRAYNCADVCETTEYCEAQRYYRPECYYSSDCGGSAICLDGYCVSNHDSFYDTGYVQTCGYCNNSGQCAGRESACTLLASNEQVCTQSCRDTTYSSDCPNGYACVTYGDPGNFVTQCLPLNDSCDPNYCTNDWECSNNSYCISNRCVAPYNYDSCTGSTLSCAEIAGPDYPVCVKSEAGHTSYCTNTCSHDLDCGDPRSVYTCALTSGNTSYTNALDSGVCMVRSDAYCQYSMDCPGDLSCVNGRCTVSCYSDRDCMNSYSQNNGIQDYYCAGGYCQMVDYHVYMVY